MGGRVSAIHGHVYPVSQDIFV
ncbi:hypothetical protein PUN4_1940003 [Paraburkholderia unamae]|nr:hypothetical protein PUN4_1940003 [Paraburkholderia unamae]